MKNCKKKIFNVKYSTLNIQVKDPTFRVFAPLIPIDSLSPNKVRYNEVMNTNKIPGKSKFNNLQTY